MTEVYVDAEATLDAAAARGLRFLADAGVAVTVIAGTGAAVPSEVRAFAGVLADVPPQPNAPAWYLTGDVARCQGSSARLRTVLIGAAPPEGSVRRCDAVYRDVQAAVFEILALDASAPVVPLT